MSVTWTRETVSDLAAAYQARTLLQERQEVYTLIRDVNASRWSDTEPFTTYVTDQINNGIARIYGYGRNRVELLSTEIEADVPLLPLPWYALGTEDIHWVKYDGDKLPKSNLEAVVKNYIDNVDEDSLDSTGTPSVWLVHDLRHMRFVCIPDATATLKVLVATVPPRITQDTDFVPIPAHLNGLPALYAAGKICKVDGALELAKAYDTQFWHETNKLRADWQEPIMEDHNPTAAFDSIHPDFDDDEF